jgi:hypothetical protein
MVVAGTANASRASFGMVVGTANRRISGTNHVYSPSARYESNQQQQQQQ